MKCCLIDCSITGAVNTGQNNRSGPDDQNNDDEADYLAGHINTRVTNRRLDITAPNNGASANDIAQFFSVDDAKLLKDYCTGSRKARNIIDKISEILGQGNIKENITM